MGNTAKTSLNHELSLPCSLC